MTEHRMSDLVVASGLNLESSFLNKYRPFSKMAAKNSNTSKLKKNTH